MPKKKDEMRSTGHGDTTFPRCDCVDTANDALEKQGEELVLAFRRDAQGEIVGVPILETQRLNTKRPARGRTALVPNFCPFCGKQYISTVLHIQGKKARTA